MAQNQELPLEEQVKELQEELAQAQQEKQVVLQQQQQSQKEQEITSLLVQAGAADVEVGLLLVQKQLAQQEGEKDPGKVITRLQAQKPWLFNLPPDPDVMTAGVRGPLRSGRSQLQRLAQQARQTGSRRDMQEYLRVRRGARK